MVVYSFYIFDRHGQFSIPALPSTTDQLQRSAYTNAVGSHDRYHRPARYRGLRRKRSSPKEVLPPFASL